jgi:lipocalin
MLLDVLRPAPVASIDEVLSIMTAIDSRLPDSDGVKWFNRLYLQVTRSVRQAVSGPSFRDARFMTELDVVFANQYFAAIAAGEVDVSRAPSAWTNAEVLWTLRRTPRIRDAFFDTLDRSTGLAGRGLLTPTRLDLV